MPPSRAHDRVVTSVVAGVVLKEGANAVLCMMVDYAPGGARLRFNSPLLLPARFRLRVPRHGLSYDAEVRWRAGTEIGVALVEVEEA